ncbi:MAG TPA: hypothetical protein DHW42_02890 [Candidatus Marinimicrobia bacterium]|nr:hypothetical protein [Candidatus Neomarinimicrobiota bacterium]
MIFARFISTVLHPFIVAPVTFFLLLQNTDLPVVNRIIVFSVASIAAVFLPLIHVYLMKRRGHTSGLDIPEREKRISPFIVSIINYSLALIVIWLLRGPKVFIILMWAYVFNTIVATLITKYWKISIHGMALGGPIAALGQVISLQFYWFIPSVFLMLYSRVKLKAHTPMQVLAGFILGFFLTVTHYKLLM